MLINFGVCIYLYISIYVNIYAHTTQSFQLGKEGKNNTESVMNLIQVNIEDKKRRKCMINSTPKYDDRNNPI